MVEQLIYSLGRCDTARRSALIREDIAMRLERCVLMVGVGLLLAPTLVLAHHALKLQFDTNKTITLTGAVKRIDWRNPHVRLYLDVKNVSNNVIWEVEMGSPNLQFINGWKIDTYRNGDRVEIDAYPARDGSNVAFGTRVRALRR
ncbi:MAG TPA: DUF6152 family protein [Bryobacteraceae bacterium]